MCLVDAPSRAYKLTNGNVTHDKMRLRPNRNGNLGGITERRIKPRQRLGQIIRGILPTDVEKTRMEPLSLLVMTVVGPLVVVERK